jgi:protein SCO1/2
MSACATGFRILVFTFVAVNGLAQPGQPAPALPSLSMQDANLKPALPGALEGVGIDQRLDAQIPLDLTFRDESGSEVRLGSYFQGKKPVLLAPVYYRCPMLCTQILGGVASTLKAVSFDPGRDFEVVAFSFDPKDTPETASSKRELYLRRYNRANTSNGWHFLTGDEKNIQALTAAIGYRYKYDPATDQYAHASGIVVATPDGHVSRYFYGVEFAPRDVRLGLVEASENKIGNAVDQVLLFCFHYDPSTGKYGTLAVSLIRVAGAGFVVVGGVFLVVLFRRERKSNAV